MFEAHMQSLRCHWVQILAGHVKRAREAGDIESCPDTLGILKRRAKQVLCQLSYTGILSEG